MSAVLLTMPLQGITVTIKVTRQFRVRLWICRLLLKAVVVIGGANIEMAK